MRSTTRRASLAASPGRDLPTRDASGSAVAAVFAARTRAEARALAVRDVLLARELHIGRPVLGRTYDDGGLVDLNSARPAVISAVCKIGVSDAHRIVSARDRMGGVFSNVDEISVAADLPYPASARARYGGLPRAIAFDDLRIAMPQRGQPPQLIDDAGPPAGTIWSLAPSDKADAWIRPRN